MVTEMWNDIVTETQGAKRLARIVARNGAGNGARNGNRNGDQNQFTLILLCICVGSAIQGRRSRSSQQVTAGPLVAIVWPTALLSILGTALGLSCSPGLEHCPDEIVPEIANKIYNEICRGRQQARLGTQNETQGYLQ